MGESVLIQARGLVGACRYLEALDVLRRRIDALVPEPMDVGTDNKGVYERVIEFKIYYERNDK